MKLFTDLHIHSKHSGATSKFMDVPTMTRYAKMKGLNLLGTGDALHLKWRESLISELEPSGLGLYLARDDPDITLVPSAEVSCEQAAGWHGWKVHILVLFPSLDEAGAVSRSLFRHASDIQNGRPTVNLFPSDAVKCIKDICPETVIIPCHIWTPYYSLYGSKFGFESIHEAFKDEVDHIDAVESGLSADPRMCRMLRELDEFPIISASDAHSPHNLGREATVLEVKELSYLAIKKAISQPLFTIEFFPQEGKYHWDGHRKCGYSCSPDTSRMNGNHCPKCGSRLTVGVQHRVEFLADRKEPENVPKFYNHVPLVEILSQSMERKPTDSLVQNIYHRFVTQAGNEFKLLYALTEESLAGIVSEKVLEAVVKVRKGMVEVVPGYDGVYGEVKLWNENHSQKQMGLFNG